MKLPKIYEHCLKNTHIDFATFTLLGMFPQNKSDTVILLAPSNLKSDRYFNMQYRGTNSYFTSLEDMLNHCVEKKYFSNFTARRISKKYHKKEVL